MTEMPDPRLSGMHVCRQWFVAMDLPSGLTRYHAGVGTTTANGVEWIGVSDDISGRVASIQLTREPYLGEAVAAQITMVGVDAGFLRSVHDIRRDIEGRQCSISLGVYDQETQLIIGDLIPMMPRGYMSAPEMHRSGIGVNIVRITVESMWAAKNFPPGGRWNGASWRARYPGDLGLNYVGQKILEQMK